MKAVISVALAIVLASSTAAAASQHGDEEGLLSWTRLGRPFGGGSVADLATLADGALLAGGAHSYPSARVWYTADGVSWDEVPLPGRDYSRVTDIDASEGGILAVGLRSKPDERPLEGVVWTSLDGLEWSERHRFEDATPVDAIATADGLAVVTAGHITDGSQPISVWHSIDGADWQAFPVSADRFEGPGVVAERTSAGAWVLAAAELDQPVRLWRSDDGKTWEPTAEPVSAGWRLGRLLTVPTGFLFVNPAVVDGNPVGSEIWHSVDGREWTESFTTRESIMAMAAGPTGFVALTIPPDHRVYKGDFPVSMLRSEDGLSWSAVDVPELEGLLFRRLAVLPDGQLLAIRRLNDIAWMGRPSHAPPLVLPEPTPGPQAELLDFKALVKGGDHPEGAFDDVAEDIIDYFRTAGEGLDPLHLASPPISDLVRVCKRVLPRRNDRLECVPVLLRLYQAHGLTRERLPYELADRWLGVTMDGAATDHYRQHLLERMKWVRVSYPDWLK